MPGGVVWKHEPLEDAVHRVAREELGVSVRIDCRLVVYEHFYETADVESESRKHYIPVGYVVRTDEEVTAADYQHSAIERFEPPFSRSDLHPYVSVYLEDAELLDG